MFTHLKSFAIKLWKDESAQGATEYILLLVAVVGVLGIFRNQIMEKIRQLVGNVGGKLDEFIG